MTVLQRSRNMTSGHQRVLKVPQIFSNRRQVHRVKHATTRVSMIGIDDYQRSKLLMFCVQ